MNKSNWNIKKLRELGTFDKGTGISKTDILARGVPCIRYAEIYTKYDFQVTECKSRISAEKASTSKPITKGTLLFASSGETAEEIGKSVAYLGQPVAYASGDTILFKFNEQKENPLFYSYYLNTIGRKQLNRLGEGQSIVHIYPKELAKVQVPCPPIEEQKKIVEVLDTWDKAIGLTKQLIAQKELQKKYLMQQLLTGRTRLKGFTDKWKTEKLNELIQVYQGYPFKSETYTENGKYNVLTIANVQQGHLEPNACSKIANVPPDLRPFQKLEIGDIVLSMTGNVGRSCYVSISNCLLNQRVAKIKGIHLNPQFLYYSLQNPRFIYTMVAFAQGGAQANLSVKDIKNYMLHCPANEREQRAIAEVLSSCDQEIDLLKQKLTKLEEQKKGLMQVLLTGKIRL